MLLKINHPNKPDCRLTCVSLLLGWLLQLSAPVLQAEGLLEAGDAFDRGEFVTALDLYDALAEGGDAQAQYRLGAMYEQGLGTD